MGLDICQINSTGKCDFAFLVQTRSIAGHSNASNASNDSLLARALHSTRMLLLVARVLHTSLRSFRFQSIHRKLFLEKVVDESCDDRRRFTRRSSR